MVTMEFMRWVAFLILFGILWRTGTTWLATRGGSAGRWASGMAYIY